MISKKGSNGKHLRIWSCTKTRFVWQLETSTLSSLLKPIIGIAGSDKHRRRNHRELRDFGALSSSGSPKPHPSKPHPCNMPQAKTEVALQFSECCAAEVALQHSLFCSAEVVLTKSCAAASKKPQRNIEKAALQESGAFLPLSCGFQAPTFRHPRLGPADF